MSTPTVGNFKTSRSWGVVSRLPPEPTRKRRLIAQRNVRVCQYIYYKDN